MINSQGTQGGELESLESEFDVVFKSSFLIAFCCRMIVTEFYWCLHAFAQT